jgi:arylsulfatase A-like enzyme/Tfp pilus assembly protein PilF
MSRRRKVRTPDPPDTRRSSALRRFATWAVGGGALLVLVLSFALPRARPAAGPPRRPNVLLVTIDTLRADHLGCYGYADARTPVLDGLAARGVRFATAVAHGPLTAPSHASILTGLTPPRHGVRDNGGFALAANVPMLPAAFLGAGYRTTAFVSGFPLDRRFGFARGFEAYDDRLRHGGDPRRAAYVERTAEATTAAVLRWLDGQDAARPWFAWVHYFDPHAPYEPPPAFSARFATRPYDGEVAFVDEQLGAVLRRIEQAGSLSSTLVLVTADHGESLGEHGEETHGVFVYDATLKVPFLLAGPRVPAGRVASTVARGIDVAPTLLDLAGLPADGAIEGRSLRPALEGREMADEPAYAESLFAALHLGWAPLHAWRTARFKLVDAPRPELYALDTDAAESKDLAQSRPDVVESLRRPLRAAMAKAAPAVATAVDAESGEKLRSLGYLWNGPGGGAELAPAAALRRNPRDGIRLVNRLEHAIADARARPREAERALAAVLAEDPHIRLARRYRAIALAAAGDSAAAVGELRALEKEGPLAAEDLVLLGECLRLAGRPAEALAAVEQAEARQPRSVDAPLTRARVLVALGRREEARSAFERALSVSPDHAAALQGLGDLALEGGDLGAASALYERARQGDPADPKTLLKLGVVRVRAGRADEAIVLFREAVERAPHDAQALLALAGALAKVGRPAEAVPYLERAVQAGARSTAAFNALGFARLESGDEAGALASLRASLAIDPRQPQVAETVGRLDRGRDGAAPRTP